MKLENFDILSMPDKWEYPWFACRVKFKHWFVISGNHYYLLPIR